jgi:hypothetical protein
MNLSEPVLLQAVEQSAPGESEKLRGLSPIAGFRLESESKKRPLNGFEIHSACRNGQRCNTWLCA